MSKQKNIINYKLFFVINLFIFFFYIYFRYRGRSKTGYRVIRERTYNRKFINLVFVCSFFLEGITKIDNILSSFGINVARTGSSMMMEVIIAMRGLSSAKQFGGMGSKNGNYHNNNSSSDWFLSDDLSGTIGRMFTKGAMQSVTEKKDTITSSIVREAYKKSLSNSGKFSNNVIGSIAKKNIANDGSITGSSAVKAFESYMGVNQAEDNKSLSNVDNSVDNISNFSKTNNGVKKSGTNENTVSSLNESNYEGENNNSTLETCENNSLYNSLVQDNIENQDALEKENPSINKFSGNTDLSENIGIPTEQVQVVSNGYTNNPVESMDIPEEQVQTIIDNSMENINIPAEHAAVHTTIKNGDVNDL